MANLQWPICNALLIRNPDSNNSDANTIGNRLHANRPARPHGIESADVDFEDMPIKKQECPERLILRAR